MDVEAAPVAGQEPLTDGGCLPAWDRDDLPAPVPFGWKNLLALIGPGIVLIGSSIGTGEWVMDLRPPRSTAARSCGSCRSRSSARSS